MKEMTVNEKYECGYRR